MTAPKRRTRRRGASSVSELDVAGLVALIAALDSALNFNECLHIDGKPCDAVSEVARDACDVCHRFENVPSRSICAGASKCPAAESRGCRLCGLAAPEVDSEAHQ